MVERLSKAKIADSPKQPVRKTVSLSQDELNLLTERLSSHKKAPEQPEPNRGEKRSPIDIDRIVER